MTIGILLPSIYASISQYGDMIFAPRNLCLALADGLVKKGHTVFLFTSGDSKTRAHLISGDAFLVNKSARTLSGDRSFSSERMKWASFYGAKRYFELDLTEKCFAMAKQNKIDIIHSYHDTAAHFFEESMGVPTVYTLHDPLPIEKDNLSYWLFSHFSGHSYVAISNAYRQSDVIGLRFIDTVHHGIPCPPIKAIESDQERSYLLNVSRLAKEKGIDMAIQAAKEVKMPLHIVTSLSAANKNSSYYNEVVSPQISKSISLEQFKSKEHMWECYSRAFALLFPIHWEEPFGMVMIEAMACGTPVIAYNRGSVPEVVKDGVTGFIIDPPEGDETPYPMGKQMIKARGVDGLCEAIRRLKSLSKDQYQEMRRACRKHVEEHFSIDQMVSGYERVYETVLQSFHTKKF